MTWALCDGDFSAALATREDDTCADTLIRRK